MRDLYGDTWATCAHGSGPTGGQGGGQAGVRVSQFPNEVTPLPKDPKQLGIQYVAKCCLGIGELHECHLLEELPRWFPVLGPMIAFKDVLGKVNVTSLLVFCIVFKPDLFCMDT